jgi:hypothetical protein
VACWCSRAGAGRHTEPIVPGVALPDEEALSQIMELGLAAKR